VTYILSDDIPSSDVPSDVQVVWVAPHQRTQIGELQLETLRSTDEGVAFVLLLGEQVIYYAGDLNWWYWEGESEAYNTAMAEAYREEMARLPEQIDLAFVPVDPRLGSAYSFGVEGLLAHSSVKSIVPMHMWDDHSVIERLQKKLAKRSSAIVALKRAPYTWRIK
ncbi:MAG TPA: MBL fold metallo-hydrolase, partial [Sphaerochaeta sp.]|nr:MBL fold metallo-hydrolase [Sphaerochaeta sp.]